MLDAAAIIEVDLPEFVASIEPTENTFIISRRDRLSIDPRKLAALQRARRKIAHEVDPQSAFAVTKLRLNAGLSQTDLARLMGTHQPAIARLEKGQSEPNLSTMMKLSEAFGVPPETVMAAFVSAREASQKK